MLDRIEFVLSEAFISLRRNLLMTFAAVTTSAMALFILGGLGYAYARTTAFANSLESRFEMKVFLKNDVEPENAVQLKAKIEKIPGVKQAVFKDKKQVYADFLRENPGIDVKGLDLDNPMPDTYTVTFSDLKQAKAAAGAISSLESVDQVRYLSDEQDFLENILSGMRWLGVIVGGVMLLTSGVLIYNTIRLAIIARSREIKIMRLVGATRAMVLTPMFLEGGVEGAIGGLLASLVLWGTYLAGSAPFVRTLGPIQETFPIGRISLILVLLGAAYGLLCSLLAVREPKMKGAAR